jgi:hypothetical protein
MQFEAMEKAHLMAPSNKQWPASARQIYYVFRLLIEQQSNRPLTYEYFIESLLPTCIKENGFVVYGPRIIGLE